MRKILFVFVVSGCLAACSGGAPAGKGAAAASGGGNNAKTEAAASADTRKNAADAGTAGSDGGVNALMDTAALKSDMDNVLSGIASGKMDTNTLKKAAKDYLSTSQKMLSDSGIDALYGNSSDPAVRSAAETLKKMRNASGLTPDKLDSLKKAADLLKSN